MGIRLISSLQNQPPAFWLNLAVKVILISLLAFGAFSGLQQFEGKALIWRLATYPIAAFVVPVIWAIRARDTVYRTPPTSSSPCLSSSTLPAMPWISMTPSGVGMT